MLTSLVTVDLCVKLRKISHYSYSSKIMKKPQILHIVMNFSVLKGYVKGDHLSELKQKQAIAYYWLSCML